MALFKRSAPPKKYGVVKGRESDCNFLYDYSDDDSTDHEKSALLHSTRTDTNFDRQYSNPQQNGSYESILSGIVLNNDPNLEQTIPSSELCNRFEGSKKTILASNTYYHGNEIGKQTLSAPSTGYRGNAIRKPTFSAPRAGCNGIGAGHQNYSAPRAGYNGNAIGKQTFSAPRVGYNGHDSGNQTLSAPNIGYKGNEIGKQTFSAPRVGFNGNEIGKQTFSAPRAGYNGKEIGKQTFSAPRLGYKGNEIGKQTFGAPKVGYTGKEIGNQTFSAPRVGYTGNEVGNQTFSAPRVGWENNNSIKESTQLGLKLQANDGPEANANIRSLQWEVTSLNDKLKNAVFEKDCSEKSNHNKTHHSFQLQEELSKCRNDTINQKQQISSLEYEKQLLEEKLRNEMTEKSKLSYLREENNILGQKNKIHETNAGLQQKRIEDLQAQLDNHKREMKKQVVFQPGVSVEKSAFDKNEVVAKLKQENARLHEQITKFSITSTKYVDQGKGFQIHELEDCVQSQNHFINTLRNMHQQELRTLHEQLDKYKQNTVGSSRRNNLLEQCHSDLKQENRHCESRNIIQSKALERLEQENSRLRADMTKKKNVLTSKHTESIVLLESEISALKKENGELKEKIKQLKSEINLNNTPKECHCKLQTQSNVTRNKLSSSQALEQQNKPITKLEKDTTEEMMSLGLEVSKLKEEAEQYRNTIRLQKQQDASNARYLLQQKQNEVRSLQRQVEHLQAENKQLHASKASLDQSHTELKYNIDYKAKELNHQSKRSDVFLHQLNETTDDEMSPQLNELKNERDTLPVEIALHKRKITDIQEKLHESQQQIKLLLAENQNLKPVVKDNSSETIDSLNKADNSVKYLKEKITEMNLDKEKMLERIKHHESEEKTLSKKVFTLEEEKEKMIERIKHHESEEQTLSKKVFTLEEEKEKMLERIKHQEREEQTLSKKVLMLEENLEAMKTNAETSSDKERKSSEMLIEKLKSEHNRLQIQIKSLESEKSELLLENTLHSETAQKQEQQLQSLSHKFKELKKEQENKKQMHERKQRHTDDALKQTQHKLDTWKERVKVLETENIQLKTKNNTHSSLVAVVNNDATAQTEKFQDSLADTFSEKQDESHSCKVQVSNIKEQSGGLLKEDNFLNESKNEQKHEVSNITEQPRELLKENEFLNESKNELKHGVSNMTAQPGELLKENKFLNESKNELNPEVINIREQLGELIKENKFLNESKNKLSHDVSNIREQLEELLKENECLYESKNELNHEVSNITEQLEELLKENQFLYESKNELASLNHELNTVRQQHEHEIEKHKESLENIHKEYDIKIKKMQDQISRLLAEHTATKEKVEQLHMKEIAERDKLVERLQHDFDDESKMLVKQHEEKTDILNKKYNDEIKHLQEELVKRQTDEETSRLNIEDYKIHIDKKDQLLKDLEKESAEVKSELSLQEQLIVQLQSDHTAAIKQQRKQLELVQSETQLKHDKINEQFREELNGKDKQIKSLEMHLNEMEKQVLKEKELVAKEQYTYKTALKGQMTDEQSKCRILEGKLKEQYQKSTEVYDLLTDEQNQCKILEEKLKEQHQKSTELYDLLIDEQNQCKILEEKLKEQHQKSTKVYDLLIDEQNKCKISEEKLKEHNQELTEKDKKLKHAENELKDAKMQNLKHEDALQKIESNSDAETNDLKEQIVKLLHDHKVAERLIQEKHTDQLVEKDLLVTHLENEAMDAKSQVLMQKELVVKLQREHKELQREKETAYLKIQKDHKQKLDEINEIMLGLDTESKTVICENKTMISNLNEEHIKALNDKDNQLQNLSKEIAEANTEITKLEDCIKNTKENLETEQKQHINQMVQTQKGNEKMIENLKEQHTHQMAQTQKDSEKIIENLKEEHTTQITQIQKDNEKMITNLNEEQKQQLHRKEQLIDDMKHNIEESNYELLKHEHSSKDLQNRHNEEIKHLMDKLIKAEECKKDLELSLVSVRNEINDKDNSLKDLAKQLKEVRSEEKKCQMIKKESDIKINELERQLKDVQTTNEIEQQRKEDDQRKALAEKDKQWKLLLDDFTEAKTQVVKCRQSLSEFQLKHDAEAKTFGEKITQLQIDHGNEVENLRKMHLKELEKREEQIKHLQKEGRLQSEEVENLQRTHLKELEKREEQIKHLQNEVRSQSKEVENLQRMHLKELEKREEQIKHLQNKAWLQSEELENLRKMHLKELEKLEEQIEHLQKEARSQSEKYKKEKITKDRLLSEMEKDYEEDKIQISRRKESVDQICLEYNVEIRQIKKQLMTVNKDYKMTQDTIEDLHRKELAQKNQMLAYSEKELEGFKMQITAQEETICEIKNRCNAEIIGLKQQLEELQNEKLLGEQRIKDYQKELTEKIQQLTNQEKEFSDVNAQQRLVSERDHQFQDEINELKTELAQIKSNKFAEEKMKEVHRKVIAEKDQLLTKYERDLGNEKKKLIDKSKENRSLSQQIVVMKAVISQNRQIFEAEKSKYTAELTVLRNELVQKQTDLSELTEENTLLINQNYLNQEANKVLITENSTKIEELTNRLSTEMSTKVSSDETSLENVSIINRPMNIASEYEMICSNEWHDAKGVLDRVCEEVSEEDKIKLLCSVLESSETEAKKQHKNIMAHFQKLLSQPLEEDFTSTSEEPAKSLSTQIKVAISDCLRNSADKVNTAQIAQDTIQHCKHQYEGIITCISEEQAFVKFVETCARLAWMMVLQQPPMYFNQNGIGLDWQGESQQDIFWGSSDPHDPFSRVMYYVHPALYHGDSQMVKGRVYLGKVDQIVDPLLNTTFEVITDS